MDLQPFCNDVRLARSRVHTLRYGRPDPDGLAITDKAFLELEHAFEQLKLAEEELRAQNREIQQARAEAEQCQAIYQDFFDYAPDAYIVTGLDGDIRHANQEAARLFRMSPIQLQEYRLADFLPDDQRTALSAMLDPLRTGKFSNASGEIMIQGDGWPEPRRLVATIRAGMHPVGRARMLRWMLRDITVARQAEVRGRQAEYSIVSRIVARAWGLSAENERLQNAASGKPAQSDPAVEPSRDSHEPTLSTSQRFILNMARSGPISCDSAMSLWRHVNKTSVSPAPDEIENVIVELLAHGMLSLEQHGMLSLTTAGRCAVAES